MIVVERIDPVGSDGNHPVAAEQGFAARADIEIESVAASAVVAVVDL